MENIGKLIIIAGIIMVIFGMFWQYGQKYFALGKLPGDISVEKENVRFYFPLTSSIIISIILTLAFLAARYFWK